MRAAARAHFLSVTSISCAISHGYLSGGYNWELVNENDCKRRRRRTYYHRNQAVIRSDGIIYDCVAAAARATGISVCAIWKAISRTNLSGKMHRAGGYGWAYYTR